MQRQEEDQVKLEQASELVTEVEQYKIVEADLKNQLVKVSTLPYQNSSVFAIT